MFIDNNNFVLLSENLDSEKIVFGYYNDKKMFEILKNTDELQPMNSKNKFKIYINYKNNTNYTPLRISYNVDDCHWRDLIKGKLVYSHYMNEKNNEAQKDIKNLRLNLLIDEELENKEYIKKFNLMLGNIKNKIQDFAEIKFGGKKYINVKEFLNKSNNGNTYFGNIKLKKEYNEEDNIKSKFFIKYKKENKIEEKLTNYTKLMDNYYYTIPVIKISSLYIQVIGNVVQIYPQVYLEEVIIYTNTQKVIKNIHYKPKIKEEDYSYVYDSESDEDI